MAGGIDKGDPARAVLDLIGADVLGDSSDLAGRHRGLANGIEKCRLAVVDVTHDRDHRRSRLEILGRVFGAFQLGLPFLLGRVLDLDLARRVELGADQLHRLVGKRLGDGDHLAYPHHDLDDLGDGDPERLGEIPDADARGNCDRARRGNRRLIAARARVGAGLA